MMMAQYEFNNSLVGDKDMMRAMAEQDIKIIEAVRALFHDLRSPLAALNMFSYSLEDEAAKAFVTTSTKRISATIDAFADKIFRKMSLLVNNDSINVDAIIQSILTEKKVEHSNKEVEFIYEPTNVDNDLTINGSLNEFERMLSNLINNAVEACQSKGTVNVGLEQIRDSQKLILSITDSGMGMTEETLSKLRSGISTTVGKINGQGIGFKQIREAVFNLNGKLKIESNLGSGTSIIMEFIYNHIP